jgi:hypothetical protein
LQIGAPAAAAEDGRPRHWEVTCISGALIAFLPGVG